MFLTIMSALSLIILGMAGFLGWDRLETTGDPAGMLMPVFFGGALLICAAFSKQHYRHGLYGGLIIALLGVVSAIIRIYQYEHFESFSDPKTRLILAMGALCALQMTATWREVKKDREVDPPT